ncbi:MAG TPA: response regulator [Patescibacteria group bacterium]
MAKSVLIIEDEFQILDIYKTKLEREGFRVFTAKNGKDGLSIVNSNKPDLIILDIILPGGMNGFDILEKLKSDSKTKNIPVIVLTNLDSEEKVAKEIGANDYFFKAGTTIDEVAAKVKEYLG